jgi:murein DD-endopeptidase MepM/ murein hydrolase activator NlpD
MGAFIIFNTFRTIVAERRRDIGMLRAIGASRGTIVGAIVICLSLLVGADRFYYSFLGLGDRKTASVLQENEYLKSQITELSSKLSDVKSAVSKLSRQGNQMRLMVDLDAVDEGTKSGGTGGAVRQPVWGLISDSTSLSLGSTVSDLDRLQSEIKVQEQSYQQILSKYDYNKGYFAALPALKPMDGYYSIKEFGLRLHPVLGVYRTHEGLDIINDVGTPVYAAADGTIEMAGHSGGGYGIVVVIKHGYGFQTLYGHLSQVLVREGQVVKRGDCIAKSGRTGLVSGPHLHYEVRYNGVCQNPADYFFDDISAQEYRKQLATR